MCVVELDCVVVGFVGLDVNSLFYWYDEDFVVVDFFGLGGWDDGVDGGFD